ncbi:MAG: amidohydrolase family protein [Clostridiales bacterium]|nr:amidohydrolase family protein [Clostridiales bacterium]
MKTLLQHCRIYDGTGADALIGDVLIDGDQILEVQPHIETEDAQRVDLTGKSLSSGFFDAHSHNDWFAAKNDPKPYFEPFVRQGITSFITGNCGLSMTGFAPDSPYIDKVGAGLFHMTDLTGVYPDADSFFTAIDGNTPLNIATLCGHCSARVSGTGYANRPLTQDEQRELLTLLERNLEQGACGVSLGLMYEPGLYAPKEELHAVAGLCARYDRPLTVHPRACSAVSMAYPELLGRPHLLRALDELEEITRGLNGKLQYSHAIFVGKSSFKCKDELVEIIERMRKNGVDAMFDLYAELLGVSVITVVMPTWYQALSPADKRKFVNKFRFRLLANASILLLGFGFDDIQVAYIGPGYEAYEGKTVHQIAKELKTNDLDAYLMLCEQSDFAGRVNMGPYSTPEIVSALAKHDSALYMTDAWVEEHGVQNPAIYDCFPKFLQLSLNGKGDTMPRAVRKMTGAVADRFSIPKRGYVRPGYYADLTVFDEAELKNAVPDQSRAFGIERVYVNGRLVLSGDMLDEAAFAKAGRALRV